MGHFWVAVSILNGMLTVVNVFLLYNLWGWYTPHRRLLTLIVIFLTAQDFFYTLWRLLK